MRILTIIFPLVLAAPVQVSSPVMAANAQAISPAKPVSAQKFFTDAVVDADNTSTSSFSVKFAPVGGGTSYTFSLAAGAIIRSPNDWSIPAGYYNVTITVASGSSYGALDFMADGAGKESYSTGNTAPIVLDNVEFYAGEGNQVIISPV